MDDSLILTFSNQLIKSTEVLFTHRHADKKKIMTNLKRKIS